MVGQLRDRVLLVDDEPLMRERISGYLVAAGYVVRVAVDGLDALRKLREGLPDMIISDLKMPRMTGNEFLDIVRKRFPQIPVIVMSGAGPDEMPEGLAADAYFHKNGFGVEQLLLTILALTSKAPLRPPSQPIDNKPIQARWDGNGHYTLQCEDCLRELSIPRGPKRGREEDWAVCVHFGRLARFLVVGEDPQGSARP